MVHRNLELTRRQAADSGLWHWMATIWRPGFVRHRWPDETRQRTRQSIREKFLGGATDIYSNAFGRLWWMAELTRREDEADPYDLTDRALEHQSLANRLFDPASHRYRPAVIASGEVLLEEGVEDESVDAASDLVEDVNVRFNQVLSSVQLETQDRAGLRSIVEQIVAGLKEETDY